VSAPAAPSGSVPNLDLDLDLDLVLDLVLDLDLDLVLDLDKASARLTFSQSASPKCFVELPFAFDMT
jgi:hypothetical protein